MVLAIATVIVKRFDAGLPAPSAADLIHSYGFPARLVGDAIDRLTRCKLVSHVIIDERHAITGFQPAMATDAITVGLVYKRLDTMGSHDFVPDFGRRSPGATWKSHPLRRIPKKMCKFAGENHLSLCLHLLQIIIEKRPSRPWRTRRDA